MEKSHFREFQFSRLMVGVVVPIQILITAFYFLGVGDRPLSLSAFLTLSSLMLLVLCFFYGMTTTINDKKIKVFFGIGFVIRKINLTDVRSAESVRNPWYYGYGIRWIKNGWLYNVSGAQAVELKFKAHSRIVRIGTKKPEELRSTIERLISQERFG